MCLCDVASVNSFLDSSFADWLICVHADSQIDIAAFEVTGQISSGCGQEAQQYELRVRRVCGQHVADSKNKSRATRAPGSKTADTRIAVSASDTYLPAARAEQAIIILYRVR